MTKSNYLRYISSYASPNGTFRQNSRHGRPNDRPKEPAPSLCDESLAAVTQLFIQALPPIIEKTCDIHTINPSAYSNSRDGSNIRIERRRDSSDSRVRYRSINVHITVETIMVSPFGIFDIDAKHPRDMVFQLADPDCIRGAVAAVMRLYNGV